MTDPGVLKLFEGLRERAAIRHPILLTRCAAASSPMVLSQREICLPLRTDELGSEALQAVLAHELAHIERRDGIWLHATLVLQAVLWFQPFNRKASAELMASAELAADDRAVELTGDSLALARTLTQVAGWSRFDDLAPAVAMARAGSPIVERVARLVEASDSGPKASTRSTPWLALAALAAIGACSPSFGAPAAALHPVAPGAFMPIFAPAHAYPIWPSPALPTALATRVIAPTHLSIGVARHASASRRLVASAPTAPTTTTTVAPSIPPLPPVEAMVSDVVAQVVPQAMAFSQATIDLAFAEGKLRQRMAVLERGLARGRIASEATRAELSWLSHEITQLTARRRSLEQRFQAHLQAWGQQFEARFAAALAPRVTGFGAELGTELEALGRSIGSAGPLPATESMPVQRQ